jgi:hypothetical protein
MRCKLDCPPPSIVSPYAAPTPSPPRRSFRTMMKLLALLATATALKQPLQKPLAVRGGGIDKAGVVKAVNIAWGLYAAEMLLAPSKIQNDHFVRAPVEIKLQAPRHRRDVVSVATSAR